MGKIALAAWKERKTKGRRPARPRSAHGAFVQPQRHEVPLQDERICTRILAALIAGGTVAAVARDLRIPKRSVAVLAMRERHL